PAITAFADQLSAALENARLFEAEQRRAKEATALLTTAHATSSLHLDDVLQTIASQARVLFAADGSRIHLIEPDGEILRCVVALHERAEAALAADLKVGEGITGRVAQKGAPEIVNRALADQDVLQMPGTPVEAETLALAPLKTRERVFGVMTITRLGEDRPFTPADLEFLTAFANQAAIAVENARLFEEARHRAQELEALATVSAALRKAADSAGMLPIVLDQVLALLDADGAAVAMRDAFTGETVVELGRGEWSYWTGERLPPGVGVSGQVIASGKQFTSNELDIDPLFGQPNPSTSLRAVVCAPLKAGAQTLGALWVGRRRDINASEVNLFIAIGEMAANAIHRATLHEQTERRLRRLDALRQIDAAIGSSADLRLTLDILLNQVVQQLEVDAADLLLIREGALALEYAAGRGFRTGAIARSRVQLGEGYAGRAALERRVVVVPDVPAVADVARAELLAGEDFVVHIAAPLVAKGEIRGVLEVYQRTPFQPDPEWLDYLETLAGQTAIAINDAALFEGLQRTNVELSLAYDATIEGWARALDLRDRDTEGHTRRVTEMTERLARALGFPDAQLGHLRRGALLHDIGKIGVPDDILRKPGPLDDAEWEV
ncbi:MAG: GAF domain-containing protein, partial [Anaerolineales bacterium]